MVSIAAVPNGSYHSPGFDITVSDLDGNVTYTVTRVDVAAEFADTPVRGMDGVPVPGPVAVATDYEAPIGRSTQYVVEARSSFGGLTTATSPAVTLPYDSPGDVWLKSVAQPALSRRVNMVDWAVRTTPGRILGEYEVLGRRNKVVLVDVLGGREGSFTLATYPFGVTWESDCYFRDLQVLLENGGTLLIQTTGDVLTGELDMYFEVKQLRRSRVGIVGGELVHLWEIEYVEVDQPTTALESLGLRSWQDVLDNYTTWDEVRLRHATWLDVLNRA